MIRELFISDLAYRLCNIEAKNLSRRGNDIITVTPRAMTDKGLMLITGFAMKFDRVPMDDEGNYLWPQGDFSKYSLIDAQYDGLEAEVSAAMAYMKEGEYVGAELGKAIRYVHRERSSKDFEDIYIPEYATEDEPDTILIGNWLAERCIWYYSQTLSLGRNALTRRSEMDYTDITNWLESAMISTEDTDNSEGIDHSEETGEVIDIQKIMKRNNVLAFDSVELARASVYQQTGNAYFSHLKRNPEVDELLEQACTSQRERTKRWTDQQQVNLKSMIKTDGYRVAAAKRA